MLFFTVRGLVGGALELVWLGAGLAVPLSGDSRYLSSLVPYGNFVFFLVTTLV